MTDRYLFGDSDLAARRLGVLADAFAAPSRAFVSAAAGRRLRLGVDLGCGPGYTTHLVADATDCEQVVGLDNSAHFIGLAAKTATESVSFRIHDVTTVPFPDGPSDLIYGRFLLTHLPEPEALIAEWATKLRPGGRLLAEETESIHTTEAVFATYLTIVEAMLNDRGHDLYVGRRLAAMQAPDASMTCNALTARVPVTNDLAARMFSMNIRTWKDSPFVQEHHSPGTIQALEADLSDLAATPTEETGIEWKLRQLVIERGS